MVLSSKSLTRPETISQIWETMPIGSVEPTTNPKTLAKLTDLTNSLIDFAGREQLEVNPFTEVIDRRICRYTSEIGAILQDKVVLVTGGAGFVGGHLMSQLGQFGVKRIIAVDMEQTCPSQDRIPLTYYKTDVRDYEALQQIFELEQPDVVFHLAAQRLPGLAETQIYQTITTNIFGSNNIIKLCEEYDVEACIFSSTGKASRYYTGDVYAGSKKIAEWLFSDRVDQKKCLYGIVRFTHVVENSPVSADFDRCVERGMLTLHAPDRFTYAQNVTEAVSLLLNALTMLDGDRAKLFAVTNLGWPINTLDIALHKIVKAGGNIPIYFKGVPKGYEQQMFMGHLDLSGQKPLIPMLNVLEVADSHLSPAGDTIVSTLAPFCSELLDKCLAWLEGASKDSDLAFKVALNSAVKQMATSSFRRAAPAKLLDILGWGIDPEHLNKVDVDASYYHDFAELLLAGIEGRVCHLDRNLVSPQILAAIAYLKGIPSMSRAATYVDIDLTQASSKLPETCVIPQRSRKKKTVNRQLLVATQG